MYVGLYEVDIGFSASEDNGDIMAFGDVDSDKYTDILTVSQHGGSIEIHLFDPFYKKFVHAKTIDVPGCSAIRNIFVGRSSKYLRLFVTCSGGSGTIVRFIDRVSQGREAGIEDFSWRVDQTVITIQEDSQPFIADINGDFLEDVMYN